MNFYDYADFPLLETSLELSGVVGRSSIYVHQRLRTTLGSGAESWCNMDKPPAFIDSVCMQQTLIARNSGRQRTASDGA